MLVESISTNQVARVNKATIHRELSSMRWHKEMPSEQDKAGKMPHTLHKKRPQNDKDIKQNVQTAYLQQAEQQRESLSREEQEEGPEGVTGSQEVLETTLPGTQNLSPGPFTFTYYRDEEFRRVMTSIIPREHQERTHLHGRD